MFITGYDELVLNVRTQKIYGSLDFLLQEMVAWYNAPAYGYKKFNKVYEEKILRDYGLGNGLYSPEFRKLKGDAKKVCSVLSDKLASQADAIFQADYASINSENLNSLISIIGFDRVVSTGLLTAKTIKYLSADQINGLSSGNFDDLIEKFGQVGSINKMFGDHAFSGLNRDKIFLIQLFFWQHPVSSELNALSNTQVPWLNDNTLRAVLPIDIKLISTQVISSMTGSQLVQRTEAWLKSLTAIQVASIAADPNGNNAINYLGERFGDFNADQLIYLQANQLRQLDSGNWLGLHRDNRTFILTIGASSLNGDLLSRLTAEQWTFVSLEQIVLLTVTQIQAFTAQTLQVMAPEQIWVMTIEQLKACGSINLNLTNLAVAGLTDDILKERNVLVLPDVIANAGGVTVSYFEWVQDFSSFFWSEDDINARLTRIMKEAFAAVWQVATDHQVTLRTATFIVGCTRILRARELRGLYP